MADTPFQRLILTLLRILGRGVVNANRQCRVPTEALTGLATSMHQIGGVEYNSLLPTSPDSCSTRHISDPDIDDHQSTAIVAVSFLDLAPPPRSSG
ncbi:hypothetical protein BJY52DRAFT_381619 [Lactarius psammicola]|nr:hypothetical protein BJY52DRAFT_381619 [Lactarius psammicola]